jgi:hypothetical protein
MAIRVALHFSPLSPLYPTFMQLQLSIGTILTGTEQQCNYQVLAGDAAFLNGALRCSVVGGAGADREVPHGVAVLLGVSGRGRAGSPAALVMRHDLIEISEGGW